MASRNAVLGFTLVTLSILTGCGGEPPTEYDLSMDPSMTTDEMDVVVSSAKEWETATNVKFNVTVSDNHCGDSFFVTNSRGCIHVTFGPKSEMPGGTADSTGFTATRCHGFFNQSFGYSSNVFIEEDLPNHVHMRVLHELGHAVGLEHMANSVMAPEVTGNPGHVTCLDVGQYSWVRNGAVPACS